MPLVPTLWLDPVALEQRLSSLVVEELRRPLMERLVAQPSPIQAEVFPERIPALVDELAKFLEPTTSWLDAHLWVGDAREILPREAPSPSHHRIELHWPDGVTIDDVSRWLATSVSDSSYADHLTRLLEEFGQTDWQAIDKLFYDAWQRTLMG